MEKGEWETRRREGRSGRDECGENRGPGRDIPIGTKRDTQRDMEEGLRPTECDRDRDQQSVSKKSQMSKEAERTKGRPSFC